MLQAFQVLALKIKSIFLNKKPFLAIIAKKTPKIHGYQNQSCWWYGFCWYKYTSMFSESCGGEALYQGYSLKNIPVSTYASPPLSQCCLTTKHLPQNYECHFEFWPLIFLKNSLCNSIFPRTLKRWVSNNTFPGKNCVP